MYYLVIKNLGVERCIDSKKNDTYNNNQSYNCLQSLTFVRKVRVKRIRIRCIENPRRLINATVFSD